MGDEPVELVVLLLRHLGLALAPDGILRVELPPFQADGLGDEIRILPHDLLHPERLGEFLAAILQFHPDRGAAGFSLRGQQRILPHPLGDPLPGRLLGVGGAGVHHHPSRHHEHRVETDSELPDQLRPLCGVGAGKRLHEFERPRPGDGPQVLDQLLPGHSHAGVAHRERLFLSVHGQSDFQRGLLVAHLGLGQHLEPQPAEGVRGVGNQLPEKNLPLGIERVDDDVQQLLHFRLERKHLAGRRGGGLLGGLAF